MNAKAKIASAAVALVIGGLGVAAPASAATATAVPDRVATAYCNLAVDWQTTATVNMRSGPGLGFRVYRTVPSGACMKAIDYEYDNRGVLWVYTAYRGQWGWISTMNMR